MMVVSPIVLVAVDGSSSSWQALEWAAEHAQLTGRALRIVHVGDAGTSPESVDLRGFGRKLLAEAIAALAESHPGLLASTELLLGDPASRLLEIAPQAELVAVGRGRPGLPGVRLGSVTNRVLAHAPVPVAVVPAGRRVYANTVTVGVSTTDGGRQALRFAFTEAGRRGASIVAVRSWSERDWRLAASGALPLTSTESWRSQERTLLDDCLRPWRDAFPQVPVRSVLTGHPVELAIEQESEDAAMIVLGARRPDPAHLGRLGPIASWAAHHYRCPVVVVGHPAGPAPLGAGAVSAARPAGGA
jgi:nucleotide-binding universal stress UspA family protein